ncbi:MAG TPA: enoyl-CoA hydratase-related protein, partial [Gammaproteobacteria bacterium]|nr:enoyl-CoA hydratase-related protein [Gammaproteobacteria bacterium]
MSGEIPPVRLTREGSLAILCIERPPVNAIDRQVRAGLHAALDALQAEPAAAVVLYGAGRCFIAGADIGEFERPGVAAELSALADRLAALPMPVIAAMHGAALGGGLELALASDYRLALPGTRLGLPEVGLGLIPGAGGTQRLPRVIGLAPALERICSGEPIAAEAAEALGLVDAVLPGETPLAAARAYLQSQPALARRP